MKKTVLVTGGARGIGKAIVENFAENGYNIVLNYLTSESEAKDIEERLSKNGRSILAVKCDVTNSKDVSKMVDMAYDKFGKIDVLVNNAGICQYKLFTDINEDEWDQMINVHLKGMYNLSKSIVPRMIEEKKGKIINISSVWGMVGGSCEVSYSTAKAGMIGFTKALAKELGPSNIQVNAVAPGVIDTAMNNFSENDMSYILEEIPMMRIGKTEEVASIVIFLASEGANYITGQVISPNGGMVV